MSDDNENKNPPLKIVGYRKPPVRTQFKKGHSGNPKGRPKGTANLASVLAKNLRERVVINENGRRKTITKLEAAAKQLTNKAASGDPNALRQLLTMIMALEDRAQAANAAPVTGLDDADEKVLRSVLKRLESGFKGEEGK